MNSTKHTRMSIEPVNLFPELVIHYTSWKSMGKLIQTSMPGHTTKEYIFSFIFLKDIFMTVTCLHCHMEREQFC